MYMRCKSTRCSVILLKSPDPWLSASVQPHCFFVYMLVSECRRGGGHGEVSGGGGVVSSLTSILPLARRRVESLCKSHVITPPPARVCVLGIRRKREEQGKVHEGGGEGA